jgi:hypothetical protein
MARYASNLAMATKIEATYGTDALPTVAANAILAANVEFQPSVGDMAERDLITAAMGHQGVQLVGSYATLAFDVEIAGSGTAGTAPACGPLLRASAMKEVVTAGQDVKYSPISTLQEAVSIYFNDDGVNHVLLGARGNLSGGLTPKQIPRFRFTMTGLLGIISDVPRVAPVFTAWKKPVPVSKANTDFSLHAYTGPCEGFTFDLGNQIEPRFLIGYEGIEHVDRKMTGNATLEATLLATKNWFQAADSHVLGALASQHGKTAGNIVTFSADAVQIGRPTRGQTQKIVNYGLPLMMTTGGANEFTITFK